MKYSVQLKDGKEHFLQYDLYAISEFEEAAGSSVFALEESKFGIRMMGLFIWAGLLHENDRITLKYVLKELVDHENIAPVFEKAQKALNDAFPKGKGEEKNSKAGQKE